MNENDTWEIGVHTPDGVEVFTCIGKPSFQDIWCMFIAEDGNRRRISGAFPRERVLYVERRPS